jgi:hypothetical protein
VLIVASINKFSKIHKGTEIKILSYE